MARGARSSKKRDEKAQTGSRKKPPVQAKDEVSIEQRLKTSDEKGGQRRSVGFSEWLGSSQGALVMLAGILLLALFIRAYFYYDISFDTWPPKVVGNDPSYHLRVIEYVEDHGHHLKIDDLLNYPLSGGNPRPPIFDWSIVIMSIVLSPLFGFNLTDSTWFVFQFAPAIWGALTVIPAYLLGKEMFGRKAGILGAFLLAITASHIERSTLGFTDHDAFIVFFLVLAIYFVVRAFKVQNDRNYILDWRRSDTVILGFRKFFSENREAVGFAALAGLCIATISMTWEGYAYILAIILIYYMVQLLIQRFRNEDTLGTFVIIMIVIGIAPLLSLPYYFVFSIATWSQGFYILLAMVGLGLFIVPTRDIPWLIVIPTLILLGLLSYFLLLWSFPDTANMLFTGGGYFVKSKLYSTIAEAQAPDLSRVVFTYGPATFFLGLAGIVMAVIGIPKHLKKDYMLVVIWTIVAIFMALRATRFTFNATPAFTLLAGWVIIEIVRFFKAEGMSIVYSVLAVVIFLGFLGTTHEDWNNVLSRYYIALTIIPIVVISLAYVAFMKYRKHRENFRFRSVIAALFIGFVVIFPNVIFATDASIPYETKEEFDPDLDILGTFGSSFHSEYWGDSYAWLATQDEVDSNGSAVAPADRPAFMSWWDYGFDEIVMGQHPTAADNFQNGYQFTGSMIASVSENEGIALMTARVLEGDWVDNKREHFSDDVWDVLVEHLGTDKNSTTSAYALQRIYKNPGAYIDDVEGNPSVYGKYLDVTAPNALYAAAKVIIMKDGEEATVDFYHDVRVATGESIRYFAVDSRLFPFSAQNTGIFYAPIKLADRNIDDYLEYRVYAQENTQGSNENPNWVDYPDNPITMEKAKEESERLGYKFRVERYDMFYTDDFYNSMFYKTYIGYSPKDVGSTNDGKTVPGFGQGTVGNLPPMQGWNMTHWKLVYRTMYYSTEEEANASFPNDYTPMESTRAIAQYRDNGGDVKSGLGQGVFYLKYYDGAVLKGTVKTERGTPAPGIRVTVLDDYGIMHGTVLTDENGTYTLISPPGEVTVVVSTGDLTSNYDMLYGFQIDQSTSQPSLGLNVTTLTVSDDLAMRVVDDGIMPQDFVIPGKTLSGQVYWDVNDDSSYKAADDEPILEGNISLSRDGEVVYGPVEIDSAGKYRLEDVVPGTYTVVYTNYTDDIDIITDFKVDPKTETTRDLKVQNTKVVGTVTFEDGSAAANQTVLLKQGKVVVVRTITDPVGNFTIERIFPGIYDLSAGGSLYMHAPVQVNMSQGATTTSNMTLLQKGHVEFKAYSTVSSGAISGKRSTAGGSIVSIFGHTNRTRTFETTLDPSGVLSMDLPVGEYDMHIIQIERGVSQVHLGSFVVEWNRTTRATYDLVPGYYINGTVARATKVALEDSLVQFTNVQGTTAYARIDKDSRYGTFLPLADYKVTVDNTTSGGTKYFNMQDLMRETLEGTSVLDIFVAQTISVKGTVYWDKDLDGRRTTPEEATEINNLGGKAASEVAIAGLPVRFHYPNGTIKVNTLEEGVYEANLPPATYTMTVDAVGFENFSRVLAVEDTTANRNFGINDTDAPLHVLPREFVMNVSFPLVASADGSNMSAANVVVEVISQEPYMNAIKHTFMTDGNGMIGATLPPAEYLAVVGYTEDINGLTQTTTGEQYFFLEPGDGTWHQEISVERTVHLTGVLQLVENSLVKYPAEVAISFNPAYGEGQTIASATTDFNGRFEVEVPLGNYVLEAHEQRAGTNYVLLVSRELVDDIGPMTLMMAEGFPVSGTVGPAFSTIQDSYLLFRDEHVWTTTGISNDGSFGTVLPKGEYTIHYRFSTAEAMQGEQVMVNYTSDSAVTVSAPIDDLRVTAQKSYQIHGTVYHDISADKTIQVDERKGNAEMTFTSTTTGMTYEVTADSTGDYSVVLPVETYMLTVSIQDFQGSPKAGYEIVDLTTKVALWDIQVEPRDNLIAPKVVDWLGRPVRGMEFTLREANDATVVHTGKTDGNGYLHISVRPAIYNVLGLSYVKGMPALGYSGRIDLEVGKDISGSWVVENATRVKGTVFYKDTDGVLHDSISSGDEELVWKDQASNAEYQATYNDGTYTIDLPTGDYRVSASIETTEHGIQMDYIASKKVVAGPAASASDYAIEFAKSKTYTFELDLVNVWEHELRLNARDTVILQYFIENTGNEPFIVTVGTKDAPAGWTIEYPDAENVTLSIGEKVFRQMNITVSDKPEWSNKVLIEGSSDHDTTNNFEVSVVTPPSYGFTLTTDRPDTIGIGFDEEIVFNLTVENLGTGEDVVTLKMDPTIEDIEDWEVQWEGKDEFPENGENASVTPEGTRSFAVTVKAPSEDVVKLGDTLELTFHGKNRHGDSQTRTVLLEINRPNLLLPPGFIKLTNRRLDDAALNGTIEANITVQSQFRAAANVNVTLFIDGREIAYGVIDHIPQDGIGNVRLTFNVTTSNITVDDYHAIQVIVDPLNRIVEQDEGDNVDGWDNVVLGHVTERTYVNWRIVVFVTVVLLVAVAIIAYKQRTHPI